MKPLEFNSAMLKINECPREEREQRKLAHSKGKPGVSSMTTNISVRFATPLPIEVEIRRRARPLEQKPGPMPARLFKAAAQSPAPTMGEL